MKKRTKKIALHWQSRDEWQGRTLPDYVRKNLDIVFVGLNPGLYSVAVGHYFANKANRFWEALSASGLVPGSVGPEDDARLMAWGIGLTDIVKRPTGGIHEVSRTEFRRGAKALREKIIYYAPRIVCFNGLTGYRVCCGKDAGLGDRDHRFGGAHVFAVPSTSPRNAHYSLRDIVAALHDLKEFKESLQTDAR